MAGFSDFFNGLGDAALNVAKFATGQLPMEKFQADLAYKKAITQQAEQENQMQSLRKMAEQATLKDAMGVPLTPEDYASVNAFNRFQSTRVDAYGNVIQPLNIQLNGQPQAAYGGLGGATPSSPTYQTATPSMPSSSLPPSVTTGNLPDISRTGGVSQNRPTGFATINEPIPQWDTPEMQQQAMQANAATAQAQSGGLPAELPQQGDIPSQEVASADALYGQQAPQEPEKTGEQESLYQKEARLKGILNARIAALANVRSIGEKSQADAYVTSAQRELDKVHEQIQKQVDLQSSSNQKFADAATANLIGAQSFLNKVDKVEKMMMESGDITGILEGSDIGQAVSSVFGREAAKKRAALQAAISGLELDVAAMKLKGQGQITESERKIAKSTLPQLTNDPEANFAIIEGLKQEANDIINKNDKAAQHMQQRPQLTPEQAQAILRQLGQ